MAAFSYTALDKSGSECKGVIEADSSKQVRQTLREQGYAPLSVELVVAKENNNAGGSTRYRSLSTADLALITRQLATLVRSGMPLEESLYTIVRQAEKAKIIFILSAVRSKVLEGHSLANSMAEFPSAFPKMYRATIAAGEHSGYLDNVLDRLADYTESAQMARQKVQLALLYPLLLMCMSIAIVAGLMIFVVPDIIEVFVAQQQELPLLTRLLMSSSNFTVNYGLLLLVVIIIGVVLFRLSLRNPQRRKNWHQNYLKWPIIRRLSRAINTSRFSSTLSILTGSGVPLVDAMAIAGEVMSNDWLRYSVKSARQRVSEGVSLHQALEGCVYFPPMMIQMIASGEASGDLDLMLQRVAENQHNEQNHMISAVLGILEPAMLVLMGVVVLLIVVAILQPIFSLNQLI